MEHSASARRFETSPAPKGGKRPSHTPPLETAALLLNKRNDRVYIESMGMFKRLDQDFVRLSPRRLRPCLEASGHFVSSIKPIPDGRDESIPDWSNAGVHFASHFRDNSDES
jgi:hypothetical protein